MYPGCTLLDFAGATQVFAFAKMTPVWLAATLEPVVTTEGVRVVPERTFADPGGSFDLLFVPGGGEAVAGAMHDPVLVEFVRETGAAAQWAGSVCTGAFILAAAGLLDGYEATTYWSQRENLARFPKVRVAAGAPRWVIQGNRFTGGGVSSSVDLALELVSRITGPAASMEAQLLIQYAPAPPFASGDPAEAPPEVVARVLERQTKYTAVMRQAVETLVGK